MFCSFCKNRENREELAAQVEANFIGRECAKFGYEIESFD